MLILTELQTLEVHFFYNSSLHLQSKSLLMVITILKVPLPHSILHAKQCIFINI